MGLSSLPLPARGRRQERARRAPRARSETSRAQASCGFAAVAGGVEWDNIGALLSGCGRGHERGAREVGEHA